MIDPAIFVCFQNIGIRAHKIHCIININNNLAMSNFLWVRIYIVTTYCEYETYWLITSKTRGLDVVRTSTSHWWVNALWVFSICYVDVQLWRSHRQGCPDAASESAKTDLIGHFLWSVHLNRFGAKVVKYQIHFQMHLSTYLGLKNTKNRSICFQMDLATCIGMPIYETDIL